MRDYRSSRRILFPYVFKSDKTGYVLAAFNREYKYIPRAVFRFARKPRMFDGIWYDKNAKDLYMNNDDPHSRTDYFERLAKLFSHKHDMIQDKTVTIRTTKDIDFASNISSFNMEDASARITGGHPYVDYCRE